MTKALFFDVDSTVRKTKSGIPSPNEPEDVKVLPGAAEALTHFRDEGYLLIAVSNQGGIELGYLTEEQAIACFETTWNLLEIHPDHVYYCPSFNKSHPLRKPNPGVALEAVEKYGVDLAQSWMVGDMKSDLDFATRAGIGKFIWAEDWLRGKF